jgi:hypothetical protein
MSKSRLKVKNNVLELKSAGNPGVLEKDRFVFACPPSGLILYSLLSKPTKGA